VFGNSAYKYISVAYLQIMKSMTPVPTLLVSFLIGREKPTWAQLLIVVGSTNAQ
jgi:drug/metabolite transporter (DMT)-like permease